MSPAPSCMNCNVERTLVDITPVKNRHEMLRYECPKCSSVFQLVTERAEFVCTVASTAIH